MNFLTALFRGAKAIWEGAKHVGRTLIQDVLQELDRSAFGRAATKLVEGLVDHHLKSARELVVEEDELAKKYLRDGRRTEGDIERLEAIRTERNRLRIELDKANTELFAAELRSKADETIVAQVDDDELSANVGILSAKRCPRCDGTMRIRQGDIDSDSKKRKFYWQCTETSVSPCPTIKLDPEAESRNIVRTSDLDLDTAKNERRAIWNNPTIVTQTHARVRQHLGDEDSQLICPVHVIPLKLMPKRLQGGLVLDSYEYICLGVMPDGKACAHTIKLQTMPQVAAMLRRTEGEGIIRA